MGTGKVALTSENGKEKETSVSARESWNRRFFFFSMPSKAADGKKDIKSC